MKHGKKLLSVFLSVVMLLGLLPTSALAAGTEQKYEGNASGTITWNDGDYITSWKKAENEYNNQLNLGTTKGTETKITVNGKVTAYTNLCIVSDTTVTIQGGEQGGTICFDNSNYKNNGTIVDARGSALFANNQQNLNFTLKDITIEYANMTGNPSAVMYAPLSGSTITLDNVTFKKMPYEKQISLSNYNENTTFTLKNKVNFSSEDTCLAHFYLGKEFNGFVLDNFSSDSIIKLMITEGNLSGFATDPALLATGAKRGDETKFEFKSYTYDSSSKSYTQAQSRGVYYAGGNLYVGTKAPTADMVTDWEIDLGTKSTITNATISGDFRQLVTKDSAMNDITITPASGYVFQEAGAHSLNDGVLKDTGLIAEVQTDGSLKISGTPNKDVMPESITWPTPVADSKTIDLGTLPEGMELADDSGKLTQTISSWAEFDTITLKLEDGYILKEDSQETLSWLVQPLQVRKDTDDNGDVFFAIFKPYDPAPPLQGINKDLSDTELTDAVEAVITDNNGTTTKYAKLADAITAAGEGTVEMKKKPTEVTNATLNSGVTLKDTTGNTYKATGGDATVSVDTSGKVTLTTGKLEVTPSDTLSAGETADVTVKTGSDATTTVSGSDPFTVTAANGDTKATVTIPTANKSVTTGTGLTFTAGSANATFPLDGSKLNNNGDAVTVGAGKTAEVEVGAVPGESESATPIKVKVPGTGKADTTDAVTVTKGDGTNTMATVTVKKAGDSFTVGGKTYVAGANDTEFTIDKDGSVKLTSGGLSLGDGESTTGAVSGKTILNPTSSGGDTITVEKKTDYDEVTVPKGGNGSVHIQYLDTYANKSTDKDLVLKVTEDGVSVLEGEITRTLDEGRDIAGITSGATIANPTGSGNDSITVTSDKDKDRVTVPAGTDKSVTITKKNETSGVNYTNGSDSANLVIDVTAAGASLSTGNVELDVNEGIGVNRNTITNTSATPIIVKRDDTTGLAGIELSDGQSFTDKDGNTYTANGGAATFEVDTDGDIRLKSGSAKVIPDEDKGARIEVAKKSSASVDDDFCPVTGGSPFIVTAGNGDGSSADDAKATVTILTQGASVFSNNLTFTAGENGSTFPLDGSELTNDGDSIKVVGAEDSDITVKVGTTTGESATDINVTIPGSNTGATTVTKGQPTIVKLDKSGDTFKVGETTYTAGANGEEYAIDMTTGTASKVEAKVFDANGNMVGCGGLASMLNNTPVTAKTIEMVIAPETAITNATLNNGVTLKDLDGNQYKANGEGTKISVDTTGKVSLTEGKLDVTPAATKTASVAVAKKDGASSADDFTTVTGEKPFTVTAGKGTGTGEGEGNDKATVTIPTVGETVTVGENADKGLTFTAGQDGSTFPLDGSKLNNTGDSITVGKDFNASHDVQLSDNVTVTVPDNSGATTVTKGQPAGFDGKVTLDKSGDKFTVGGTDYTAAANDTTFAVKKDGDTTTAALVSGAVKVPAGGSTDVRPDGWSKSVSVETPADNTNAVKVSAVPGISGNPAKGKAEVKSGDSVKIGGKEYTAAADDTAFIFDENGNVTLDSGKAKLDKTESILGGVSGVEIKNTSAESITDPVTVEKGSGKDIVTVPAGGKVTIGGKEYTNSGSGEMKLEIDAQGNVTLADGKADFGKDTSLNLNGAEIKNTGNSALTMTESGSSDTLNVAEGGSFTVGTGTVKDPSADMSFTINDDGTLTATLPENGSVTINGVKYTGGAGGATLKLDKDGNITSITGTYAATIPGSASYTVSGIVKQEGGSVIEGATVKLTQGGKEVIRIAPVKTNSNGEYVFPAVPAGTYNVVVEKDGKTLTQLVTVSNDNVTVGDLVLPSANVSSVVDVKPTSPVGAMVGGLDTVASNNEETGKTVKITLSVDTAVENNEIAALSAAAGKTLVYLDMSLVKTVDGSPAPFSNSQVLEIILTFDTTNKTNITVYRCHDGNAEALTKLDSRPSAPYTDGTYYVGNGFVVVYTSKFSPYAIGYDVVSYSGGSGGSGSSASTSINVGKTTNGSVSVSPKSTGKGNTVTITVKPDAGFKLGSLTVTDKNGNALTVKKLSDTQYTFIAPAGKVDVKAVFVKAGVGYADCAKDSTCPVAAFTDTLPSAWYHDGVHYCVDNGLMSGYSNGTFAPDRATTRAQLVVMLWRLNGCPVVDSAVDFTDVPADAWCAEAIRWAKATGVSGGYGDGTFGPDNTMTREQMVTFLYRYAQNMNYDVSVGESTNILSFADAFSVSEYAIPAMQWACGSGMMAGKRDTNGDMILMPQGTTTRAQMATMLMRFCAEIVK